MSVSDHSNRFAQRGSATVEFVGVGVIVTCCALAIMQLGIAAHVSAVLTDSAIAGAAHAALADSSLEAGAERARDLAEAGIAGDLVQGVSATPGTVGGSSIAVVTIRYRIPSLGVWVPSVDSTVTGRAFLEIPG